MLRCGPNWNDYPTPLVSSELGDALTSFEAQMPGASGGMWGPMGGLDVRFRCAVQTDGCTLYTDDAYFHALGVGMLLRWQDSGVPLSDDEHDFLTPVGAQEVEHAVGVGPIPQEYLSLIHI